jgi:glucose/arabinose dehydrogenase
MQGTMMSILLGGRRALRVAALVMLVVAMAAPASAQLRSSVAVSGLSNPVAFVQDPSNAAVQYVVQLGGVIRVVQNGTLLSTPLANLSTQISTGGERGLLGLAFPPNYAASGRFYVCFTNPSGHIVVARLRRSSANPLVWDGSRLDLLWPGGNRFITHPLSNHNGGHIAFGPDGFLYVGIGDGGGGNDPDHNAQNPATLLGKMLRINVAVADGDNEGYDVPPTNPFVGQSGYLPEIWSLGLRNPWRWSFDNPALGGTGAMVIGDVGQGAREEIDYEPAGLGGRNYGWRNREGFVETNIQPVLPPAFTPLTDPIFDYGRGEGRSITGGFVYRGSVLGAAYRGRYFFADFVTSRVWSIGLDFSSGSAVAVGLLEHTAELGGSAALGGIASFGVDAAGELYLASFNGTIIRIVPAVRTPAPILFIDTPANGAAVRQPFLFAGWAIDSTSPSGTGMGTAHHVWAFPLNGAAPVFVGTTSPGARPDVAAYFGSQFLQSGWGLGVSGLAPGAYRLAFYGWVNAIANFGIAQTRDVTIGSSTLLVIDTPANGASVGRPFILAGWAIDTSAPGGTGVDGIHVWAFPVAGGPPTFVGTPVLGGSRPDVGAYFGSRFTPSGYNMVANLPPGQYDLSVYAHSSVTRTFDIWQVVRITVR